MRKDGESQRINIRNSSQVDLSALKEAMLDPRYYEMHKFLELDNESLIYYFFLSSVDVGKTWRFISEAIVHKVENNENTIWLRRRQTELTRGFATEFFRFHKKYLPHAEFAFKMTKDGCTLSINGDPFLYCHALSTILSHGNEAPDRVWAIIFDEFMPSISSGQRFLTNETFLLKHCYKSLTRSDDKKYNLKAKVLFGGNNHITFCPYYTWLGINFNGKDIYSKYYRLITEYIPPIAKENKETPFFESAGSYTEFAVGNKSSFKENFDIRKVKNYQPLFNLKMGDIFLCVNKAANTFYITRGNHKVTTYGLTMSEMGVLPDVNLIGNSRMYSQFRIYVMFGKVILADESLKNDYQTLIVSGVL